MADWLSITESSCKRKQPKSLSAFTATKKNIHSNKNDGSNNNNDNNNNNNISKKISLSKQQQYQQQQLWQLHKRYRKTTSWILAEGMNARGKRCVRHEKKDR